MTDAVTTPPYETWTIRELRDELRARSLPTSGSQAELAARLTDADALAERLTEPDRDETQESTGKADKPDETRSEPAATADTKADVKAAKVDPGECVVNDGTAHTGRATPGAKICSAHAMHYKADGTSRVEAVKAAESKAEDVKRDE